MSENIQSISQGNYILQGTVATSAGIVGDGSTQNPLRADETVLFSGNEATSGVAGQISLYESPYNFERLRIFYRNNDWIYGSTEIVPYNNERFCISTQAFYASQARFKGIYYVLENSKLSPNVSAIHLHYTTAGANSLTAGLETSANYYITQVIGINRKA